MSKEEVLKPHKVTSANKTFWGMNHLNGNLLCVIDVETTGFNPVDNGIIEICIVPLNQYIEPHEEFRLFHMRMKPEQGEDINEDALRINKTDLADLMMNAFQRETVSDLFLHWFQHLNLVAGKRLLPLACNWPFDRNMIEAWLGRESFDYIFDSRYRDVQTACLFLNDCADVRCEQVPFPKVNLKYLCSQLKIEHPNAHTAIGDCIVTAQIYKRLMTMRPTLL